MKYHWTMKTWPGVLLAIVITTAAVGFSIHDDRANATIASTFRTTNLAVDHSATFGSSGSGQIQIGTVAPDPSQQVVLLTQSSATTQAQLWIQEDDTGHTGNAGNNEAIEIVMRNNTEFDLPTGSDTANASGVDIVVAGTHTGSGVLACTAVRANAACDAGTSNYSFYGEHGAMRQFDSVSFGPGDVGLGSNVDNFEVPGSSSTVARIGIGTLPSVDGTQLQTKNTVAASALAGLNVALDTTLNAAVRGGLVIYEEQAAGMPAETPGDLCSRAARDSRSRHPVPTRLRSTMNSAQRSCSVRTTRGSRHGGDGRRAIM